MSDQPLLARLFAASQRQDGCISSRQLERIGIRSPTVVSLVERGAIHRAAHAAYVVGVPILSQRQLLWTALLTAGDDANVSHWSAGGLYRCARAKPGAAWVTTPGRRGERVVETLLPVVETGRAGRLHIVGSRRGCERRWVDGFPVVTPARAMVEMAAAGEPVELMAAWREADYRNLLRREAVEQELGRGIAGTQVVRELMRSHPIVGADGTKLETRAEHALLAAVLATGLPRPLTNAPLRLDGAVYFPDQFHREVALVVEADGGVHGRQSRRGEDGARDAHMRRHGLEVLRIPNDDIEHDAAECAQRVVEEWFARRKQLA